MNVLWQYITVWIGDGLTTTEGRYELTLDQFGDQVFVGEVIQPEGRIGFPCPSTTNLQNGGDVSIEDVPGFAPLHSRCITTVDGLELDNTHPPASLPGNVELIPAWPTSPTRDQVCTALCGFQGLTVHSDEFGDFPVFGPETSSLSESDLLSYFAQVMAAGWTAVQFAVSWNYHSPTYQYPIPGRDLSQNLPELKRRVALAITAGFRGIYLFMAGDGLGGGPNYNDAIGWTYGREWLLANFQRIYDGMGPTPEDPRDCRPFLVFLPGYDGTDSYGWETPEHVVEWWAHARAVIDAGGVGYLGQEYGAGHCQIGGQWDGPATYINGPGRALDVILQEFPADPPMPTGSPDSVWQILGRMIRPYHRPPEQPSWDDPNPPYYLAQGTPRGPYYYVAFEYDTYTWVRHQVSPEMVRSDRQYLKDRGCQLVS